ncbi:MAG: hypothetical protein RL568_961 [Actinomycetota bacterium]
MDSILNPLYIAVSWVIVTIHKALTPIFGTDSGVSWSLAIIGLVILIRIILIPLFVKQIKSQRALTALQPHMKEIQKKYKDDRQKQSEEMMKLYKEHKTNPLASCFPILAQAPIFFALFTVLNGIGKVPIDTKGVLTKEDGISAAQAEFFGAPNIYNPASINDKGNAKDGFIKQYDVATAKNYVVRIPNHFRNHRC